MHLAIFNLLIKIKNTIISTGNEYLLSRIALHRMHQILISFFLLST